MGEEFEGMPLLLFARLAHIGFINFRTEHKLRHFIRYTRETYRGDFRIQFLTQCANHILKDLVDENTIAVIDEVHAFVETAESIQSFHVSETAVQCGLRAFGRKNARAAGLIENVLNQLARIAGVVRLCDVRGNCGVDLITVRAALDTFTAEIRRQQTSLPILRTMQQLRLLVHKLINKSAATSYEFFNGDHHVYTVDGSDIMRWVTLRFFNPAQFNVVRVR